jgi:predicted glycogen debranching enzyme
MRIERDELLRLSTSLGRMWLETDGRGGYAASNVLLCPTSRFHGLLVSAWPGMPRRHVFLARFEETLALDGREVQLSTVRYGSGFRPEGHRFLDSFDSAPVPAWEFRIGDVRLRREVLMLGGAPATLVRWELRGGGGPYVLSLRPFLACRQADSLTFANDVLDPRVAPTPGGFVARPYAELPPLAVTASGGASFVADAVWTRGLEYADDLARGYGGHEDQFSPGRFDVPLSSSGEVVLATTLGAPLVRPLAAWRAARRARRREKAGDLRTRLARAAEHYLYRTQDGRCGVVAGYPWYGEWGRDTCIALPGLLLPRGEVKRCGEALAALRPWLREGRLPNRFLGEETEWAATDPTLWFARAVRLWDHAGGDRRLLASTMVPMLGEVAEQHLAARGGDLACGEDGLLRGRGGVSPATWMDATTDGVAVTPREGCAVEVNALWFFLLAYLARLERRAGRREAAGRWASVRDRVGASFLGRFWHEEEGWLADVADGAADLRIRPNMVIAAALEFSPLARGQRAAVVDLARRELVTPTGLRSLSPRDPGYRGRFEGDLVSRNAAIHQGTVWPWLLGFYVEAYLRAHGRGPGARRHVRDLLAGLGALVDTAPPGAAIGHLPELFDGDLPQRAAGAWAQAWSVAEVLRACALAGPSRVRRDV